MYLSGSVCERAIVLPGGGPPAYVTTATSPTPATERQMLGFYDDQSLSFDTWQAGAQSLSEPLISQIAEDIPFSSEMGMGLWYFGRMPFLFRLQATARGIGTPADFHTFALQSILMGRFMTFAPTLPGYLSAMATRLSVRSPNLSPTQWRMWLDFGLAGSYPLPEPSVKLWTEIIEYQIPVPGSPHLSQMSIGQLLNNLPRISLLPIAAAAIGASYQIYEAQYYAAWVATVTGAGSSIVLAGTQSMIQRLLHKVEPIKPSDGNPEDVPADINVSPKTPVRPPERTRVRPKKRTTSPASVRVRAN